PALRPGPALDEGASAKGHENRPIMADRTIFIAPSSARMPPRLTTRLEGRAFGVWQCLQSLPIDLEQWSVRQLIAPVSQPPRPGYLRIHIFGPSASFRPWMGNLTIASKCEDRGAGGTTCQSTDASGGPSGSAPRSDSWLVQHWHQLSGRIHR